MIVTIQFFITPFIATIGLTGVLPNLFLDKKNKDLLRFVEAIFINTKPTFNHGPASTAEEEYILSCSFSFEVEAVEGGSSIILILNLLLGA